MRGERPFHVSMRVLWECCRASRLIETLPINRTKVRPEFRANNVTNLYLFIFSFQMVSHPDVALEPFLVRSTFYYCCATNCAQAMPTNKLISVRSKAQRTYSRTSICGGQRDPVHGQDDEDYAIHRSEMSKHLFRIRFATKSMDDEAENGHRVWRN